ncbi:MAG: hypothetical protein ACXWLJ_01790 [Rhizomicrobium sp.]
MEFPVDRRHMLFAASGAAASLVLPQHAIADTKAPLSPERSLETYRRTLCGAEGDEVLWWYIGDLYLHTPGKSVTPVARALTIGRYKAGKSTPRTFHHHFHEVGAIVDLDTGEPLRRNPLTGAPIDTPPLVEEADQDVEWAMQDDGTVIKTALGHTTTQTLRWTETSANLLLVENDPTANAFALASGDSGTSWQAPQATRTFYAKKSSLARPGFVPAQSTYELVLKLTPPWLANPSSPGDHFLVVRGVGQKSRVRDIVNQDALDLVRHFFPKFI